MGSLGSNFPLKVAVSISVFWSVFYSLKVCEVSKPHDRFITLRHIIAKVMSQRTRHSCCWECSAHLTLHNTMWVALWTVLALWRFPLLLWLLQAAQKAWLWRSQSKSLVHCSQRMKPLNHQIALSQLTAAFLLKGYSGQTQTFSCKFCQS